MLESLFGITAVLAEGTAAAGTSPAAATDAAAAEMGAGGTVAALVTTFLPMVILFAVFYFFLIRPQRKKDKQVKEMLNNLKAGDRVCTIGGIYGTIVGIKDDTVTLSVGRDDTNMVLARWGIRSVEEVTIENDAEALN